MWGLVALMLLCGAPGYLGLPRGALYPFGEGRDEALPVGDDVSTGEINLWSPVYFFDAVYETIYVNTNGLLSFRTEIPEFFNVPFPLEYPLIAPFYSNVDTSGSGTVWYRESYHDKDLSRAVNTVRGAFSTSEYFEAETIFVATWDNVGYHSHGSDKVNTYQVVIINGIDRLNNNSETYVEILYPQGGLQWSQGNPGPSGLPDARGQAGIGSEDGRLHILRGSGTDQVLNLDKYSNTGTAGQWLFRVGPINNGEDVEEPNLAPASSEDSGPPSCAGGGNNKCHSSATCIDTQRGFCCKCNHGFYGNGFSCLKNDIPFRVNGKTSGTVNGQQIQMDLQSYIVMSDGRAYTALSKVPVELGPQLQFLNVFGTVIGWLFAVPVGEAQNGYQLTGGVFNHTADIVFTETGHKVTVIQRYIGLNLFDQLRLEAEITGELPPLPAGTQLAIDEFFEEYSNPAPGDLRSVSTHKFKTKNSDVIIPYEITQKISFTPCPHSNDRATLPPLKLKVNKNFIGFEGKERILRYGMSDRISISGQTNPCTDGTAHCSENSACVSDSDSYQCVCDPGYQHLYAEDSADDAICIDINECQAGNHGCDINAQCINQLGSYICTCHPDYSGDGRVCTPIVEERCEIVQGCAPTATCSLEEICVCIPGYSGDGYTCVEDDTEYTTPYSNELPPYCSMGLCSCPQGYYLDGELCIANPEASTITEENTTDDDVGARPLPLCYHSQQCTCPQGYAYVTRSHSCEPIPGYPLDTMGPTGSQLSCNIVNTCHPHAQCIYSIQEGKYGCVCNAEYVGDGFECNRTEISCMQVNYCDVHATCIYSEDEFKDICVCDNGYEGDGRICTAQPLCRTHNDCGMDAECVYSISNEQYECTCREGFERDENEACIRSGLCSGVLCAQNARCAWDDEQSVHYCECEEGYIGDGLLRCQAPAPPCNVLNNCALHAKCLIDHSIDAYSCHCDQGFQGDGLSCSPIPTCFDEPSLCPQFSHCVATQFSPQCQCDEGYSGNGTFCKRIHTHENGFLLLNQGMATLRVPYKSSNRDIGRPIQISYYQMAIGIDIDCAEGRVYWSDITGRAIKSSTYNGLDQSVFTNEDIGSPEGLAIDWDSRLLYWTDSNKKSVEVASLNNPTLRTTLIKGLTNPRGIAVHPGIGKLFWSDWNRQSPKLEWSNMDGSGREIFLEGRNVHLPNSLAIKWDTNELCYADAGTKSIECVSIDQNRRIRTVYTGESNIYPFGLAITDEQYYWTDWESMKIESVDIAGSRQPSLAVPLGGSGNKLYGMVAVGPRCPYARGPCGVGSPCPVDHLCLPNSSRAQGYACICANPLTCNIDVY